MSNDILDGFANVRRAFLAANLNPPASINLETHDDGMRMLSELAQTNLLLTAGSDLLGKPVEMADGSVFMECQVMGMKIRWPADRYAMPDGSWKFV